MSNLPWTKKYCPVNIKEIIAQDLSRFKQYVENYKKEKKKAMIIYGASGCGKTCAVYALASELGLEVIEINASDLRNKDQINSIVGAASQQMSLFAKGKIILVDEMDGIAGRKDFGGIAAITKLIGDSKFPMIMTANNPFDKKFSSIRKKCEMLEFKRLGIEENFQILKGICEKEGIEYDKHTLRTVAVRSTGDARGAITDLQILASMGKIEEGSVLELAERNKTDTIVNALMKIFKTTDVNIAINALENVEEDIPKSMLWIDENLPYEYTKPEDLARAYDKLSKADVYLGRIRRWMHWRFLIYANAMITAGVAVSKDEKNKGFTQYKQTGRILKLWWAKQKTMKKKAIAEKIAEKTHTSKKQILKNFEYYKLMIKNNGEAIATELDLDKEEIAYLKK